MASDESTSNALLRRKATRRAVLAGGVAAAGVAGAYAATGDRLRLFGDDGPTPEAVRSDTSAIKQESVKINHLLRRAGFGMTKEEYDHYHGLGLQATLEELLAYNAIDDSEAEAAGKETANATQPQLASPAFAWLARMAKTKRPLQEKMTLFWHGLLTSQISVVVDAAAMTDQIDFYRTHALDRFPDILKGASKDRAMMSYLDVANSTRGAPNENYARELMELFALGVGNFSEKDVREASRAFTGWQVPRQRGEPGRYVLGEPVFRPQRFDSGSKTVLGKTGNFGPDDIVDIIVEQPASAQYIVRRLFAFFVYANPTEADLKPFVETYVSNGKSIRSVVEALFRSDIFYSPKAYRALVKSPVEYFVSAIKAVNGQERVLEAVRGGQRRGGIVGDMGQTLYEPPNVAGWPGNEEWLNASTMFARLNFVNGITGGGPQNQQRPRPNAPANGAMPANGGRPANGAAPANTAPTSFDTGTASQALAHYLPMALDDNVLPETRQVLLDYAGGADVQLSAEQLRGLVYLILGSPQFHLS